MTTGGRVPRAAKRRNRALRCTPVRTSASMARKRAHQPGRAWAVEASADINSGHAMTEALTVTPAGDGSANQAV